LWLAVVSGQLRLISKVGVQSFIDYGISQKRGERGKERQREGETEEEKDSFEVMGKDRVLEGEGERDEQ